MTSDKDLFAAFKKTAPRLDVQFMLDHATMSDALRADFVNLRDANLKGPKHRARYVALQDKWRQESNAREAALPKAA